MHATRWIQQAVDSGIESALFDLVPNPIVSEESIFSRHYFLEKKSKYFSKVPVFGVLLELRNQYKQLRSAAEEFSPDIIHCHWLFHSLPFVATFLKCAPIISTPWGSDLQLSTRPLRQNFKKVIANQILTRRIISHSDDFCCDSRQLAAILKKKGARVEPRIVYFGTDLNKFCKDNRSEELRDKFGASKEDILVISNRSHEEIYDIPTLIRAAHLLKDSSKSLKYVIAGSGSLTDTLKASVYAAGLNGLFYFTGRLNDHEFVSATASCDIYISTSKSDGGLAASTAEAMACEVPVVITEFGENAEWLCDEKAGFLFTIGSETELSDKIKILAESKELRKSMGAIGRFKIEQDNNSEIEWEKVLQMYNSVTHLD